MRILVVAVLATALLGSASIAYAADATGKIKSLDMTKDMVTLDNGSSYMAPKTVKLSDFKIGEKVTVSYAKAGDKAWNRATAERLHRTIARDLETLRFTDTRLAALFSDGSDRMLRYFAKPVRKERLKTLAQRSG